MTARVAVRGGDDAIEAAVDDAGATLVSGGDADVVVAVGEPAIRSLATDPPERPVLPVTPGGGDNLVARRWLDRALSAVVADECRTATHPVLGAELNGEVVARAAFDAALLTTDPATISEYGVDAGADPVDSFRADGVVVATPLGSDGYASAAGGPVLAPGTGVALVPVAPFSTHATVRVLDVARDVGLSVEREGHVSLFADGVRTTPVGVEDDLRVTRVTTLDVLHPQGRTEKF